MKITKENINDIFNAKIQSIENMEMMGYKLIENLFVDNSGFGLDNELAYTKNQFIKEVEKILEKNKVVYAKITSVGQFQVYVGIFLKDKKAKHIMKKIKGNTYKIETPTGFIIRYHNTNIIVKENNSLKIYNGGYETRTTKERINEFLPMGYYVFQKSYNWFLKLPDDKIIPFENGYNINI